MAHSTAAISGARSQIRSDVRDAAESVAWPVWAGVAGVIFITSGLYWDISWHQTIGRDTFWTPAHLAIQFGGILAAVSCCFLIFSTTFGKNELARTNSAKVWGFRGPIGAFLTAWGGATMVTSAPFDNWWHNSFGLDVQILSPPHVVLGLGFLGVTIGVLLLATSEKNRAEGSSRKTLERMILVIGGFLVVLRMILLTEYIEPNSMHTALFYCVVCLGAPIGMLAVVGASGVRWAMTKIAAIYMLLFAGAMWFFPLFPAEPKLGPVYTKVTHMVPMRFPLLLIVPAFFADLVIQKMGPGKRWLQSIVLGFVFLAATLAAQWPFASFLVSPGARNWIFGMGYFSYPESPAQYHFTYEFAQRGPLLSSFLPGLAIALGLCIVSCWVGVVSGDWLKRLRR